VATNANAIFVNAPLLGQWVMAGRVDVLDGTLTVRNTGETFAAIEAVRVLVEATGTGDPQGWVGRVYSAVELRALGAELLDRSLLVGELAYDVDPGYFLQPAGTELQEHVVSRLLALSSGPPDAPSDEDLLARYLMKKL
jgi:hypothetical protein